MTFKIKRVSQDIEKYNGIWLEEKPCNYAIAEGKIYCISERDIALEKKAENPESYDDEELSETSTAKKEYSTGWVIKLNTIADMQKLMDEVGEIIIHPSGRIRIYDDYID